jgi:SAM-dependent methyltransferase
MKTVMDAFRKELQDSGPVLDAGVGTGRFAAPLAESGYDIVGVDVSKEMLELARAKSLAGLIRGELSNLPFVDEAFESCVMVHVLHLVENPSALLSEVARVCRSELLSIVETSDYTSVREEYIRRMVQMGYPWSDFSERKLMMLLPPTGRKEIAKYSSERRADDDISYLRNRLSAVTWDVPDDAHDMIINELGAELGGRIFDFNTRIELVKWNTADVRSADLSAF